VTVGYALAGIAGALYVASVIVSVRRKKRLMEAEHAFRTVAPQLRKRGFTPSQVDSGRSEWVKADGTRLTVIVRENGDKR
jgi:hypothetical protein